MLRKDHARIILPAPDEINRSYHLYVMIGNTWRPTIPVHQRPFRFSRPLTGNSKGDLVGYDIYFAYCLAKDLNVTLEFIPVQSSKIGKYLNKGIRDMSCRRCPSGSMN